ncbi:hypothetical protein [Litorihabitans aurantiacus]|uniref:ABC-2 type transport system permease protein n=1 Tax=Litorihabitans aurantiacus TaxID=1930061 RepID=A0AA37XFT9_9MICO|nr:hypothetical protein [Litorihabitans aurantiacus]GMA31985.1 hypothetical protein GCM10025875_19770 [Litorihabitans aurantiacus]
MVATLARLRFRLLRNTLLREKWRIVLLVLGALYGLGLLALGVVGMIALNVVDPGIRTTALVLAGSLLVLGWTVVPVLAFGLDSTLDPQRFAVYLEPDRRFALGLLVAGAVSIPGIVTAALALLSAFAWISTSGVGASVLAVAVALVCGALGALLCFLLARVTTTAAAGAMRGRRGRDLAGLVAGALVLVLALTPSLLQSFDLGTISFDAVADVLAWTPFGAPWAIPADVLAGAWGPALARLAIVLAVIALALPLYQRLLVRSMTTVGSGGPSGATRSTRLPVVGRLVARGVTPGAAAVAGRSLRYWRGDPRYLVQLFSVVFLPLVPIVMALLVSNQEFGPDRDVALGWALLLVGPLVAWVGAWAIHDDVAYDSTAFWMHVAADVRGIDDRWGRALAVLVWLAPLALVLSVVTPLVGGRAELLPAVVGLTLCLLGTATGVSGVFSAAVPYPAPPPGSNPMSNQTGAMGATFAAQLGSFAALGVLALPAGLTLIPVFAVDPAWAWLTLLVGAATGVVVGVLGLRYGGRLLDRRAVRLLTTIRSWPKH